MLRRNGGMFLRVVLIVMLAMAPMVAGCTGAARGIAGASSNKAYYGE